MLCLSLSHEASIECENFTNYTNKALTGEQESGFANVRLAYIDSKVKKCSYNSRAQHMTLIKINAYARCNDWDM